MPPKEWSTVLDLLVATGVAIRPGLLTDELSRVESAFEFQFPEDLKCFLSQALPVSHGFPDWRDGDESALRMAVAWPFEGIAYDIEHNDFWLPAWPSKPDDLADAIEVARREVGRAPKLIPVCGHRYLPADPPTLGNPVFSVYQTDVIYYGRDLEAYFGCEFGTLGYDDAVSGEMRRIPFWSDLAEVDW